MRSESRRVGTATKSIRLSDEETRELDELVRATGEVEAAVLKRAAMRGLRDERLDRAVLLYLQGAGSAEAAAVAQMSRSRFLELIADRGITVLEAPSGVPEELKAAAALFGDEGLAAVADVVERRRTTAAASAARSRGRRSTARLGRRRRF
jgi:hypothetical protein